MSAILSGLPCEIIGSLIDRSIDFVVGQAAHSTSYKEWKKKHRLELTSQDSAFLDVYVEAVVTYFQTEKPPCLEQFFREKAIHQALYRHWYGSDSASPFFPALQKLASHFELEKQLGAEKLEAEIALFEQEFRSAVNVSRPAFEKAAHDDRQQIKQGIADLRSGLGSPLPRALTPNPFSPPVFIGREEKLEELHQKLFSGSNFLLLVNGKGGMGKTSLASRYYHEYMEAYEHVAWVLAEQNITEALLSLARPLRLEFAPDMPPPQRLRRLLRELASLKKPSLLVIDNANDADDIRDHFQALRQCSNFHLLLTTRINELEGADYFPIKGLSEPYAAELFKKYYKGHQPGEDALLKDIIGWVDHNTLIIELLAKNLQNINQFEREYSLSQLYADLQKSLLALSRSGSIHTAYQAKGTGLRYENPEAIVLAMYDVLSLAETEKQLISLFAVLPNEPIAFQKLKQMLPEGEAKAALSALTQKGWIDYEEAEKTFKTNQVVQDVVKVKQKERLRADCSLAIAYLTDKLSGQDLLHTAQYLDALTVLSYAESLINNLSSTDIDLAILCQYTGNFYRKTGELHPAMEAYQQMAAILMALCDQEPGDVSYKNGLAISHSRLGDIYKSQGDLADALKHYKLYNELEQGLHAEYPGDVSYKNGLAISHSRLGDIYKSQGDLADALKHYELYNELKKGLHAEYPGDVSYKNGLAISHSNLGDIYKSQGDLAKALEHYKLCNELEQGLHAEYPGDVSYKNNLAISHSNLGDIYKSQGDLAKALEHYKLCNELEQGLHAEYPGDVSYKNNLAISHSNLGDIYKSQGDLADALKHYKLYNELEQGLHAEYPGDVSYKNGLAISHSNLGDIYKSQGDLADALEHYKLYNELEQGLHAEYPGDVSYKNNLAISHSRLGDIYKSQGDLADALKHYELCNELEQGLHAEYPGDVSYKNNLAISHSRLGDIYKSQGDLADALEHYKLYNELEQGLHAEYPGDVSYKNNLAISHSNLGDIYKSQGDLADALKHYEQARSHCEELVAAVPQHAEFQRNLRIITERIEGLGRA